MLNREAKPGAIKFPPGAKNKEAFDALKQRVIDLEKRVEALEKSKDKKK